MGVIDILKIIFGLLAIFYGWGLVLHLLNRKKEKNG